MKNWLRNPELDLLLGGKWSVSSRAALLASPLIVLAAPLGNMFDTPQFPLFKWVLISAISVIPSAFLYILIGQTIYKHRSINPLPWWGIFVMGAVLGALKGAVMGYIGYKVGTEQPDLASVLQKRIANHAVVGLTLLALTTLLLAAYDRYTVQRNKLLRQALSQNSYELLLNKELSSADTLTASRAVIRIESALEETRSNLDTIVRNSSKLDGAQIANYLRSRSMSAIRPLSHKLWEPNVTDGGIRRFMSALQWGARAVSINPYIILFVYFATAIAPYFREGALIINIERLSIHMIMLYLTLLALEWVLKHGGRRILQVKTASILVFALIYEVVTATLSNVILNHDDKASAVVFDYLWLVFLIFSTSGLISIFTREEEFLDSLKSLLTESELKFASQKMAMSGQSQELARYIHSNIQSALINSANLIEQATEIGDEAAIRREVDRIQSILHLPDLQQLDQSANSLSLAIRRTKANWDGLMSIKTKVSGEKNNASPGEIKKLEAVLDEGLSNAFRHGQANNVNIELQATDEELRLTVSDDGVGPTGGQEGMGSQTFDTIAGSSWSLDRSEKGGAVLTLRIARTHNG